LVLRERTCLPPPQLAEHGLQLLHMDMTQSTGQASVLQMRMSEVRPHSMPPKAAGTCTERNCVCMPEPHECVQPVQSPHSDMTQSTGHGPVLQRRRSVSAGHSTPPKLTSVTIWRERVCSPLPHVSEHADHRL
jgi:hypothetical protein